MLDRSSLTARQNQDGGWPYARGVSCTEPTAYALLALVASGDTTSANVKSGYDWLARYQRSDGGWAPRPQVDQSTWVTALVMLLPDDAASLRREAGLQWLVTKTGRESSWLEGLRSVLLDGHVDPAGVSGWPWFPDTVAWVTPTCFGALALEKANHMHASKHIEQRCATARQYLLLHQCRDAGWNHGSTKALGYDSDSYPETTGQALLALHSLGAFLSPSSMDRALRHFASCQSQEALNWLKLGLLAHGIMPPDRPMPHGHGSVPEIAIAMLAETAARGRNVFLE
jgi:squalene cyclase